jgi:hypothetical protein
LLPSLHSRSFTAAGISSTKGFIIPSESTSTTSGLDASRFFAEKTRRTASGFVASAESA